MVFNNVSLTAALFLTSLNKRSATQCMLTLKHYTMISKQNDAWINGYSITEAVLITQLVF